jgi:hypothetical protein
VVHRLSSCYPAGELKVNVDTILQTRDAAEILGANAAETKLDLEAQSSGAHFMLIEMQKQ